jgi:hypothetical protein
MTETQRQQEREIIREEIGFERNHVRYNTNVFMTGGLAFRWIYCEYANEVTRARENDIDTTGT